MPKKPLVHNVYGKYVDDFLEGSYIHFNFLPPSLKNYLFYAQIVGYQNIGQKYYNEIQFFPEYMICYTVDGEGDATIEGDHRILEAGDLVFIRCYYHRIFKPVKNKNWSIYFLHMFANDRISEMVQEFYHHNGFILSGVPKELIAPHIEKIYGYFQNKTPDTDTLISQEVYTLLTGITAFSSRQTINHVDGRMADLIRYIDSNYRYGININQIVKFSGFSKNYLEHIFKDQMGSTIKDYLFKIRLNHSEELLLTSDLSTAAIAEQVGLSEYRSLHRMYKTAFNMAPSQYRKRMRETNKQK
jgi:AraC-like DNA-binding protein